MTLILSGTDGLSDVDGSAATPAIRGTDANTGIFFPAADTIAFAEGGAEAMRITSTGDVGIATTTPDIIGYGAGNTTLGTKASATFYPNIQIGTVGVAAAITTILGDYNFYGLNGGSSVVARAIVRARLDGAIDATNISFINYIGGVGTERARIDSNGNFGVGRHPNGYGRIAISFSATDTNNNFTGLGIDVQAATSGAKYVQFYNESGSGIGHINRNGTTNAVQYTTSSDYRLKENIQPMQGALSLISQLKPCTYDWKQECGGGVGQGFIAHEIAEVVPDCVSGEKDAVGEQQYVVTPAVKDEEGNTITEAVMGTRIAPVYQGIDTSFLVATLTAAIQEQQALITALTTRTSALEERLAALENNNATQ